MEIPYAKFRKDFGRQPMFCEVPVRMLDSIDPEKAIQRQYILRNPVNTESQATMPQSEHYINTTTIEYQDQGANHSEGGWPKDVSFNDEELTSRYRRRIERDDGYVNAVLGLTPNIEYYIKQNNAIELYEMYFKGMISTESIENFKAKVNNVYKDPHNRPIACINWTFEDNPKIVVAYCDKKYPITGPVNKVYTCFIWDMEDANNPAYCIQPPTACWQIACSPGSPSVIIGGLDDGRVCIFDIRHSKEPISFSEVHLAHRDPVTALLYIPSRVNTEFFSGSTDGKCMWYDIRNIKVPIDGMIMSIRAPPGEPITLANTEGVSALQYERSFPTRFLCGTDTGFVINVNRKGKTLNEVMSSVFQAHNGPVRAVHRSPCTSKMFITCGDWTTHIWSEEVPSSPIITGTSQRHQVFDVAWAPNKVTSYMSVSSDGKFRYWDLLRKVRDPILTIPLSKYPLLKIKPHEDGRLVAIGDKIGAMHLISLSDILVQSGDRDKVLMMQKYDRETRRERILENRVKEIRLKLKTEEDIVVSAPVEEFNADVDIETAESEYRRIISDELRNSGITVPRPNAGKEVTFRSR